MERNESERDGAGHFMELAISDFNQTDKTRDQCSVKTSISRLKSPWIRLEIVGIPHDLLSGIKKVIL